MIRNRILGLFGVHVEAPQVPDGPTDEELAKAAAIKKAGKMGRWQGGWAGRC